MITMQNILNTPLDRFSLKTGKHLNAILFVEEANVFAFRASLVYINEIGLFYVESMLDARSLYAAKCDLLSLVRNQMESQIVAELAGLNT